MTKETRTLLLVELGFITSPILLRSKELAVRSSTTSQCLQRHQDCWPSQESDILAKPALRVV